MKKILAFILIIAIVSTFVPVSMASEETSYVDFVEGSIDDNLVVNFTDSFWHANTLNDGRVALTGINWINGVGYAGGSMTAKQDIPTVAAHYGGAGIVIGTSTNEQYPKIEKEESSYVLGEHYVFIFSARNINPEIPAKIRVGVHNGTYSGVAANDFIPVAQYPDGVVELPQSGEWVTIKTILPASPNRAVPGLRFGFVAGTLAGASIELNSRHPGVQQAYYAKETAHNIEAGILSGESSISVGDKITLGAEVFNQLDQRGNLSQEFDWTVLDADNKVVDGGYSITNSPDTSNVVFENTALTTGKYTIVATSREYGISRFIPISVITRFKYSEHVVIDEDDNLITTPSKTTMISSGTSSIAKGSDDGLLYPAGYRFQLIEDVTSTAHICYEHGFLYKKATPDGGYVKGDRYVYSIWVRNIGENPTNVIVGISNAFDIPTKYGEIYGAEGMYLPADGKWYEYREILTCPGSSPILSFGYPVGSKKGSKIELNLNNPGFTPSYFAKEKLYDLELSADKNEASNGDTIKFNASVVNQLGEKSSFAQDFEWYVLDENKNHKYDGYSLTTQDGEALLTIESDKAEVIYVAARSDEYDMAKMIAVAVNGGQIIKDYQKGPMPQNLIVDPGADDNFSDCSGNYDVTQTGDYRLKLSSTFTAKGDVQSYGKPFNGASGFIIKNAAMDLDPVLKSGKSYVFGASVKNANGTGDIVLDVGLSNTSYVAATKPVETQNGYIIPPGDDWYNVVATMKLPGTEGTDTKPYLSFGFGIGTVAGDKFELNRKYPTANDLYFAPEEAYDITITNHSQTDTVEKGSTLSLEASVLNQLGSTGYLSQEFTWYVRGSDNTDASMYFDIQNNGAAISLTPGENAKGGKYTAIAVSDEYSGFARFFDFVVSDETTSIYVAPDGNDKNAGTYSSPLKTLSGAMQKIRESRKSGLTINEVIFLPGEYIFTETAEFTISDCYDVPVTFRALEKGTVVFKTSVDIDSNDFAVVDDESLISRFAPGMEGKIYSFDLAKAGYTPEDITDITKINGQYNLTSQGEFNTLYYNGYEQTVAQWPDGGEYAIKGDQSDNNGDEANAPDGLSFTYYRSDVTTMLPSINCDRWANAKNFWISSFEPYDYSRFRYYVKEIDTENHTITICDNPATKLSNTRTGRWRAHNLIEEITLPGEYAIDPETMMLYYYPYGSLAGADIEFSSFTGAMINLTNARNVVFDSINFAQTRDDAISMTNVSDIKITNCDFRDIASVAISGSGTTISKTGRTSWQLQRSDGLYDVIISNNNFENIGQTAVQVTGAGNVDTLTDSGVVVENNFIHNTANKSFWEAVILGGCGVTVRNNSISSVPMQAIRAWGNNHLIEYNEIFDVVTEDADCAAIYWGGSSIYQGTVVRYNYIHHTDSNVPGGQVGIYWDDMQLGQSAKYNILAYQDIDFNSNGAGATVHHYNTTYIAEKHLNHHDHSLRGEDTITRDLNYTSLEAIREDIADIDLYYNRYPYLRSVIEEGNNPTKYTSIIGNLAVGAKGVYLRENAPKYAVLSGNKQLETTDAFNDIDAQDFRLRADSELAAQNPHILNTENFDIEKIGLTREYEMGDFELIYPADRGRIKDHGEGVNLLWTSADGANRYKVEVATDPDFADVVYETETYYTSVKLPLLPVDTYYWRVSAKNISREFANEWESQDGVNSFNITEIMVSIYDDFEISTANAIGVPSDHTNYNSFNTSGITASKTDSDKSYNLKANINGFVETAIYDGGLSGFIFKTSSENYLSSEFKIAGGEKLVLRVPVKNSGITSSVRVNAALVNSGNWNQANYSLEYGSEGAVVSDRNNWTELVFTLVMPGTPGVEYAPRLVFGFPKNTTIGSAIKINLSNSGAPQVFVGKEGSFEIDLSTTDTIPVKAGKSIRLTANISTAKLSSYDATVTDDLKWFVTNGSRTGIMDNPGDFVFADIDGKKQLKIGANVKPGEYYVIAQSTENPQIRKGMLLEVSPADITLTEPEISENIIRYSLTYHGEEKMSFNTYVAGYDQYGNLVFANAHEIENAQKGTKCDIESTTPEGALAICTDFKIFTWKENLVPLAGGYTNFIK